MSVRGTSRRTSMSEPSCRGATATRPVHQIGRIDALAYDLGYRRVATNRHGFNLFYLRNDLSSGVL